MNSNVFSKQPLAPPHNPNQDSLQAFSSLFLAVVEDFFLKTGQSCSVEAAVCIDIQPITPMAKVNGRRVFNYNLRGPFGAKVGVVSFLEDSGQTRSW